MASTITSFLAWSFLPDFAATNLHSFYYALTLRAGTPRPAPPSPRFARDRTYIHLLVLLAYLAYTLYETHHDLRLAGDFYTLLGVPSTVDDKALLSRFRRLTLLHHPDKVADPADKARAEGYYIALKLARDTLLDPARRFAYDRFGPDVTAWRGCTTRRDYLAAGLQYSAPWYLGSGMVMVVMNYLGLLRWGTYWRYWAFAALAVLELYLVTRAEYGVLALPRWLHVWRWVPATSLLAAWQPRAYLPFQVVRAAHRGIVTLFIALSRVGPLLEGLAAASRRGPEADGEDGVRRVLPRVEQLVAANGVEAARLLALDLAPFKADAAASVGSLEEKQAAARDLEERVKEWMVTNAVRSDPEVKRAVQRVLEKRNRSGGVEELPDAEGGQGDA